MSGGWKSQIARRPLLAGLLGALGLGIAGGLVYEAPFLMHRRYKRTPFDDLLSQLADRDSAEKLGAAVLAQEPGFDAQNTARALRRKMGKASLAQIVARDIAQGQLFEVHGWVLPETLTMLSALAAKAQ